MLHIFGVRHLSPGASREILTLCEKVRPDAVLVEGPSDATGIMAELTREGCVPPVAVLAYTEAPPVRSFMLPFASYSPEYIAIKWALENGADAEFIDLPSTATLAKLSRKNTVEKPEGMEEELSVYQRFALASGETDFDAFWENAFEHLPDGGYRQAAFAFGEGMRSLSAPSEENLTRERFMRSRIRAASTRGYRDILVVCGAYHAPELDKEYPDETPPELETVPGRLTLMPYSYLRLAAKTGYGAGNQSPFYYELLWKMRGNTADIPAAFFIGMAEVMREAGSFRSSAEVQDAVLLARALASLRGRREPVLEDLRRAAVTVLGRGEVQTVAEALAHMETGIAVGALPEGALRTPTQDDFHRLLRERRLTAYLSPVAAELSLDLREKLTGGFGALLGRGRSEFLHRLDALEIGFGRIQSGGQTKAGWKENWVLQWSPEAEIALTEAALFGVTVESAAEARLNEQIKASASLARTADVLEKALLCGLPALFVTACAALRDSLAEREGFADAVSVCASLSRVLRYGSLRVTDTDAVSALLGRLFLRACLTLPEASFCDYQEARACLGNLHILAQVRAEHPTLTDGAQWDNAVAELSESERAAPLLSGYACALRLEAGTLDDKGLSVQISARLSPDWFEGLAARNRFMLVSRPALLRALDGFLETLDEGRFMRALVSLRRTFSSFTADEKSAVCKSLSAMWGLTPEAADRAVSGELTREETEHLAALRQMEG